MKETVLQLNIQKIQSKYYRTNSEKELLENLQQKLQQLQSTKQTLYEQFLFQQRTKQTEIFQSQKLKKILDQIRIKKKSHRTKLKLLNKKIKNLSEETKQLFLQQKKKKSQKNDYICKNIQIQNQKLPIHNNKKILKFKLTILQKDIQILKSRILDLMQIEPVQQRHQQDSFENHQIIKLKEFIILHNFLNIKKKEIFFQKQKQQFVNLNQEKLEDQKIDLKNYLDNCAFFTQQEKEKQQFLQKQQQEIVQYEIYQKIQYKTQKLNKQIQIYNKQSKSVVEKLLECNQISRKEIIQYIEDNKENHINKTNLLINLQKYDLNQISNPIDISFCLYNYYLLKKDKLFNQHQIYFYLQEEYKRKSKLKETLYQKMENLLNITIKKKSIVQQKISYQYEKTFMIFVNNYFFTFNLCFFLQNLKTKFQNFFMIYKNICNILEYQFDQNIDLERGSSKENNQKFLDINTNNSIQIKIWDKINFQMLEIQISEKSQELNKYIKQIKKTLQKKQFLVNRKNTQNESRSAQKKNLRFRSLMNLIDDKFSNQKANIKKRKKISTYINYNNNNKQSRSKKLEQEMLTYSCNKKFLKKSQAKEVFQHINKILQNNNRKSQQLSKISNFKQNFYKNTNNSFQQNKLLRKNKIISHRDIKSHNKIKDISKSTNKLDKLKLKKYASKQTNSYNSNLWQKSLIDQQKLISKLRKFDFRINKDCSKILQKKNPFHNLSSNTYHNKLGTLFN